MIRTMDDACTTYDTTIFMTYETKRTERKRKRKRKQDRLKAKDRTETLALEDEEKIGCRFGS